MGSDLTPAQIAEGERLRDAIRGSTDPQYDQWAFESWIVANGASLLTAARDAARYREALEKIAREDCTLAWTGGSDPVPSHNEDGPFAQIALAALAREREG